jgi:hypothetical protein
VAVSEERGREKSLADTVRDKWEKADRALSTERRDFWMNLSFFHGQQWVFWHGSRREVAEFPRPKDSDRVRLTINRIQPNLVNVLAKLTKRQLTFEVGASSATDDTMAGARLAEDILEASRQDQDWENTRVEALFSTLLGATAAVLVEWDGTAGEELERDPDSGQVTGTGECQLTALNIAEFALEPGSRRPQDARWCIVARAMPPEQAKEKYRLSETPKADSTSAATPLQRRMWEERGYPANVDLCTVYTLFERPTNDSKGRRVTVIGDKVVEQGGWPYPYKRLPLEVFRCQVIPMRWTGHTFVTDSRPLQAAYNHARSNMAEHMKLAGNARMAVPDTSMEYWEDLTDEPGEYVPYDASGGQGAPHWIEPPNIPRWLIQEADRLKEELDDIMYTHAISRGEAPGDRNSGLALSVLAEKDETPLGLIARDQQHGWAAVGSMVLELYKAKVTETRQAAIQTEAGVPIIREWNGKMLRDQTRATVPLESVLPHSRAAMQAWVMNLAQNFPSVAQSLNGPVLARMLELPKAAGFGELIDADVAKAQRVIHLLSVGIPVLPESFDNHKVMIAEVNRWRKSMAYDNSEPEIRSLVDDFVVAHQRLAEEEALRQREANMLMPGLGAIPQADEPDGSFVPQDFAERMPAMPGPGQGTPAAPPPGLG